MTDKPITSASTLLKELRRLANDIEKSEVSVIESISDGKGIDMQAQISHMIEAWPDVWGKGGTHRAWLERKAAEYGIDPDHTPGVDDGEGPWNQSKEML